MSTATASPILSHLASPSTHQQTPRPRHPASPQASPQQPGNVLRSGSPRSGTTVGMDLDGVLKSYNGDMRKALESLFAEKTSLQAQNTQLWKLIEKQRTQTSGLMADCERLRTERDKAVSRLASLGLEAPIKKMSSSASSSSAFGLGIRTEPPTPPQIRRHNSDRDDTGARGVPPPRSASGAGPSASLHVDERPFVSPKSVEAHEPPYMSSRSMEGRESSIVSSTSSNGDHAPVSLTKSADRSSTAASSTFLGENMKTPTLLPSPMLEEIRRESRMVFPPEVTSFMSLADSPQEATHTIPPQNPSRNAIPASESQDQTIITFGESHSQNSIPSSSSNLNLSPPSQYSTSPSVSMTSDMTAPSSMTLSTLASTAEVNEEYENDIRSTEPSRFNQMSIQMLQTPTLELPPRTSSVRSLTPPTHPVVFPEPQPHPKSPSFSQTQTNEINPPRQSYETSAMSTPRPSFVPSDDQRSEYTRVEYEDEKGSNVDYEDTKERKDRENSLASIETQRPAPLPRLTLSLLPHARISIPTSNIFPNQLGRDVLCFVVSISLRPPNAQPVMWSVAKLFSAFIDLDQKVRSKNKKGRKEWKNMVAPLPDGKAWKDFAPSKIDQRKAALEAYLQSLLVAPLSDKSDLCEFLCSDPVQERLNVERKEGYLTKKGKNFGGWKTRYFVLDGPVMEYYEARGGPHLGSIIITNAQIGRQNRPSDSTDDRDFRHAFLIIEMGKKGNTQRHVLCAESDIERDSWIDFLVRQVDPVPPPAPSQQLSAAMSSTQLPPRRRSVSIKKQSKDVVVTAAQPISSMTSSDSKFSNVPSPSLFNSMESQKSLQAPQPPGMSNRSVSSGSPTSLPSYSSEPLQPSQSQASSQYPDNSSISSVEPITQTQTQTPTPRNQKRQSVMPIKQPYTASYLNSLSASGLPPPQEKERDRKAKSGRFWQSFGKTPEKPFRPVFSVPLSDSISVASVAGLPAIVFRCIEWLEIKSAQDEEGIYRLSGSSAVIKGLKEKFDIEGDLNLVQQDENWDPHAIAGLLKTYLRELPQSVLTRELHSRFLSVMDLIDSNSRVMELRRLVTDLPSSNYILLRALTAHLILIVGNSMKNKMTLRNIGIVFSPTLGIPAGIFSELVCHFGQIFDDEPMEGEGLNDNEGGLVADAGGVGGSAAGGNGNGVGIGGKDNNEELGYRDVQGNEEGEEGTIKRNRNSLLYQASGADRLLGLQGRNLDPALDEDSESDETNSEALSIPSLVSMQSGQSAHSNRSVHSDISGESSRSYRSDMDRSIKQNDRYKDVPDRNRQRQEFPDNTNRQRQEVSENINGLSSPTPSTPRPEYPSAAAVRKAKAAARGLTLDPGGRTNSGIGMGMGMGTAGLPVSPRPGIGMEG
ncbi:hypothetical protein M231_03569 [Tremella mesenterica]|uniref:RalA-binding protein 1 n=1 Tax=Tremella mesenterica TaxID=5217 RepID=A0A4Q1BNC8_TREME|nr:hypothetical protein M231_03569 [Tremella mesenterica]